MGTKAGYIAGMEGSLLFWIVSGALALCVAALLGLAMLRSGRGAPKGASDAAVYRDQLEEIERDLGRGVIAIEEAERLRVEVSRRLLQADAAAQASPGRADTPAALNGFAAALTIATVIAAAFGLYLLLGAPGAPDRPHAQRLAQADAAKDSRPSQADMEAEIGVPFSPPLDADPEFLALIKQLRAAVADRPDELQGQALLAQNEARIGNLIAAHQAQAEVLRLKDANATLDDQRVYVDLLVAAVNGYVSPEAEAAVDLILAGAPEDGGARYYKGLTYSQTGRYDLAFEAWNSLLADSRVRDPWVRPILAQIEGIASAAGIRYRPPQLADAARPGGFGPSAADIEAASEMSIADRQDMIRGMVEGLAERLATEGGPPDEWARLIQALGVLGETDRASAIWQEAQRLFAPYPDAVDTIRLAAEAAGVAE